MFDLHMVDAKELVQAATELLACGCDGDAVVALASKVMTPWTSPFEMDELVAEARADLGMPALDRDAAQLRATQRQLRLRQEGRMTDRQLTSWAHSEVGHEGSPAVQDLVCLDDTLDEGEIFGRTSPSLRDDLEHIAQAILAEPDPWTTSHAPRAELTSTPTDA